MVITRYIDIFRAELEDENAHIDDALRVALLCAVTDRDAEVERLQQAVDAAAGALQSSQYVGGPTQREAWRTASDALSAVVTQHKGQAA